MHAGEHGMDRARSQALRQSAQCLHGRAVTDRRLALHLLPSGGPAIHSQDLRYTSPHIVSMSNWLAALCTCGQEHREHPFSHTTVSMLTFLGTLTGAQSCCWNNLSGVVWRPQATPADSPDQQGSRSLPWMFLLKPLLGMRSKLTPMFKPTSSGAHQPFDDGLKRCLQYLMAQPTTYSF